MGYMNRLLGYETGLVAAAVVLLLLGSSIGLPHFGMNMGEGGQMSGCPFMGMTAMCPMSPVEHIAAWQSMFTSIPAQKDALSILLSLLFAIAGLGIVRMWHTLSPPKIISLVPLRKSDQAYIPSHTFLQEAFSSGILNPKLF